MNNLSGVFQGIDWKSFALGAGAVFLLAIIVRVVT